MTRLYSFFDKRTDEFLFDRTLDDAIKAIFKVTKDVQKDMLNWSDEEKIAKISDSGFIVSRLPSVDATVYQPADESRTQSVQIDFNNEERSLQLDVGIRTDYGKEFFELYFLNDKDKHKCTTLVFDTEGVEQCLEWCPNCEEEVFIPTNKKKYSICPSCGEYILPCSLCEEHEMNCVSCQKNNLIEER